MLTKEAINSAIPLTEVLDNAGLFLTPVDNTPLNELVKATRSSDSFAVPQPNCPGTPSYEIDTETILFMANKKDDVLGVCAHDNVMDEIVEVASKAVQGHILFAKTVVAPAVQALVDSLQTSLRALTPSSLSGAEVIVWNPPAPLQNNGMDRLLDRFHEVVLDEPALNLNGPDRTASEIIELMLTGSSSLDEDIKAWVAAKGDTFVLKVWEDVFQKKQADSIDARSRSFADIVNVRDDSIDNTLAVFLLARKLLEEPIDGFQMPLPAYEESVANIRNQAALRLTYAIADLERLKKNQVLVRSQGINSVTVNGPVYSQWIEQGGENEVLFGNMLDQPSSIGVEEINAKKEALLAGWNRYTAMLTTIEANKRFIRVKQLLEKHFYEQLKDIPEDEVATIGNREMILKAFLDQLETVREDELNDIWGLVLRLLCRSRFQRTDAEEILSGIERVKRENPHIDVREAAAMSMIEYIASWMASQFKVNAR